MRFNHSDALAAGRVLANKNMIATPYVLYWIHPNNMEQMPKSFMRPSALNEFFFIQNQLCIRAQRSCDALYARRNRHLFPRAIHVRLSVAHAHKEQ